MKHWWGFQISHFWHNVLANYHPSRTKSIRFTSILAQIINHYPRPIAVMDVAQIYAVVAGSLFAVLTIVNFCIHLWTILQTNIVWILRHMIYPFLLRRHRLVGPWTRRGFVFRSLYILTNIFCSVYRTQSIIEAGNRTGILSLINLMPLFFGPHFDFLAGLMGVSLHNVRTIHGSAAVVSVLLSTAHAIFSVFGGKWSTLAWSSHLYGLIVSFIHSFSPGRY